jgi:PemK-like, MazF-like toxin of type II toxin-antitoxin system
MAGQIQLLWWPMPTVGEIVWCRFPEEVRTSKDDLKPRPALVIQVLAGHAREQFYVSVAYGTSQKISSLYEGEFAIRQRENPVAYALAGLSNDTKFDVGRRVDLPFNSQFLVPPPNPRHGPNPKLGDLHSSMYKALRAAADL